MGAVADMFHDLAHQLAVSMCKSTDLCCGVSEHVRFLLSSSRDFAGVKPSSEGIKKECILKGYNTSTLVYLCSPNTVHESSLMAFCSFCLFSVLTCFFWF